MKNQSSLREFTRYASFSVFGMLGVSCYILADTFFIAKGLGADGLTALNLAIPVYNFIHGTGMMLGMGGATKFSILKGQERKEEVNYVYTNTVYLALICSAVFLVFGIFFPGRIAVLLGADREVFEMTKIYLRWLLLFAPAFIFNDVRLCFVRNDNYPKLAMKSQLIGSFSNIVLDYLFIFPMKMGIFGAIFATGLSPIISMMVMFPHWAGKVDTFHPVKTRLKADITVQELSLGFPSMIAQISSGIVMIVFNKIILELEGNTGVAAYGVVANLSLVIIAIYNGIAQGAQPLLSRFYGQRDHKQIYAVLRYALITIFFLSGVLYLFTYFFAEPITSVFNHEKNLILQRIAVEGLTLYFLSNPVVGYNTMLAVFFASIEKAVPAQILSILRGLVLIIPITFLLAALWRMKGVWLAYPVTEGLAAVLGLFLYCRMICRKNSIS